MWNNFCSRCHNGRRTVIYSFVKATTCAWIHFKRGHVLCGDGCWVMVCHHAITQLMRQFLVCRQAQACLSCNPPCLSYTGHNGSRQTGRTLTHLWLNWNSKTSKPENLSVSPSSQTITGRATFPWCASVSVVSFSSRFKKKFISTYLKTSF